MISQYSSRHWHTFQEAVKLLTHSPMKGYVWPSKSSQLPVWSCPNRGVFLFLNIASFTYEVSRGNWKSIFWLVGSTLLLKLTVPVDKAVYLSKNLTALMIWLIFLWLLSVPFWTIQWSGFDNTYPKWSLNKQLKATKLKTINRHIN